MASGDNDRLLRRTRRVLIGGTVAVALLAGCSSASDSSDDDVSSTTEQSSTDTSNGPSVAEPRDDPVALDSICDVVSTDEVESITGLPLDLHTTDSINFGPPYGRCSWEPPDGTVVAASISARPLRDDSVSSPEQWWDRNLEPLKDAVISVRPLPAFGEHGYLAIDDTTVDVLWFPAPTTYVEARVYSTGWVGAPPPPPEELEQMVLELSELFAERLDPHLPLPDPDTNEEPGE